MSPTELIEEIQDGPPDRRLAALAVVDLAQVPPETLADWIRTLPEPEANQLAGAIPAGRVHATIDDDMRWVSLARTAYEQRRLPTFLVMLFAIIENVDARDPAAAERAWQEIAPWTVEVFRARAAADDMEALDDLLLFVFENYLDRLPILQAFALLNAENRELALRVSTNPAVFLAGLPLASQRIVLEAAEKGGGLPLAESWRALHERGV